MSKALSALVIGGSIGGLSTAHALLRAGCRVTVLERAPQVSGNSLGAVRVYCSTYTLHEANLYSPAERSGICQMHALWASRVTRSSAVTSSSRLSG